MDNTICTVNIYIYITSIYFHTHNTTSGPCIWSCTLCPTQVLGCPKIQELGHNANVGQKEVIRCQNLLFFVVDLCKYVFEKSKDQYTAVLFWGGAFEKSNIITASTATLDVEMDTALAAGCLFCWVLPCYTWPGPISSRWKWWAHFLWFWDAEEKQQVLNPCLWVCCYHIMCYPWNRDP